MTTTQPLLSPPRTLTRNCPACWAPVAITVSGDIPAHDSCPASGLPYDRTCREVAFANSFHADAEARRAFLAGDYLLALFLVDMAQWWLPGDAGRWDKRRQMITAAMGETR